MSEWRTFVTEKLIMEGKLFIGDGYRAKNSELSDQGLPFARAGNINNGFQFEACDRFPSEEIGKLGNKISETDDVVFTSKGTVGRFAFVRQDTPTFVFSPQLCFWRVLDKSVIFPRYLYYWMYSHEFWEQVSSLKDQTDMADYVNLTDQRKMTISLPPLPEQKAIAAVLSSLDDKIDLLHRQNKTLEALAETLFRQWFIEEAEEGWEEVTVGEFVELNSKSIGKEYPFSNIEYLDTSSITEGKVNGFQFFDLHSAPSRAKRLVRHNDVLISTVRPNQKHFGIIKEPIENLVVSTGFCVITCKRIDPHFIFLLLTNDDMTEHLHSVAEGSTSTYPSLKPSDIGAIEFQLPPKEKLSRFSIIANELWEKTHRNHQQIRTLEKLRDTLLPKLMSGEVRVKAWAGRGEIQNE